MQLIWCALVWLFLPVDVRELAWKGAGHGKEDGRNVRLMTLIGELTRECLAIRATRRINGMGVLKTMADVMLVRGTPDRVGADNGDDRQDRGELARKC